MAVSDTFLSDTMFYGVAPSLADAWKRSQADFERWGRLHEGAIGRSAEGRARSGCGGGHRGTHCR